MANNIPAYQQTVETRPLPTPYSAPDVSPGDLGAAQGAGLQQDAAAADQISREAKQKADLAAVFGATAQAKAGLNDLILDPEKGYASLKGTDAVAKRDQVMQKFQKAVEAAGANLKNNDQQQAFARQALMIQEEGFRHVVAHETTQQEAAAHAAYAGTQEETVRTIANLSAVPTTPVYEIAGQFNRIANQAKAEAVRKLGSGATQDMVAAAVLPELQRASVTAMDAAINSKSPDFARKVYAAVGDYLGPHKGAVDRTLRTMTDSEAALVSGVQLARKYRVNEFGVLDIGKAVDELNKQASTGKINAETYARTLAVLNEQNQAGHTQQQTALGGAYQTLMSIYDRGGMTAVMQDPKAALATGMLQDEKNIGGANLYDAFLKHQLDQAPTPEQDAAFWRARNAVFADEWNRYAQMGSDQLVASIDEKTGQPWAAELTRRQLEQLATLHTETKTRLLNKDQHALPPGVEAQLKIAGSRAGLWGKNGPQSEQEQQLAAYVATQVDAQVQAWWRDPKNKAPPMPADYQKWISDQLIKGTLPSGGGFGWRGSESVLPIPVPESVRELTPVQNITRAEAATKYGGVGGFTPKIPRDERRQIEQALKAAGIPVSDVNVVQNYKKRHGLR